MPPYITASISSPSYYVADPLHLPRREKMQKEKGMKSLDVAQGENEKRDADSPPEEPKQTAAIPG